jgi:thiamine transporter ThiT
MYVPDGVNPAVYSAMYNGGYLLVEFVISIYIIYLMKRTNLLKIYM